MNRIDDGYFRTFNALEKCYRSNANMELGDLLGNMDINLSDGEPMDPLMLDYWAQAKASARGFDTVIKFVEIWASKFTECPSDLSEFINELHDASGEVRREAIMAWNQPVIRPESMPMDLDE